jgi:predicted N-acetyltransferase YhbS
MITNMELNRIRIRVASSPDAHAVTTIVNKAFRSAENFFVEGDRLDEEEVHKLLGVGTFLVAEDGREMLGCVYVEPKSLPDQSLPKRAYLGLLSVDPEQQRGGVGSKLMDAAEDYCRELGCHFMDIKVVNLRQELPGYYQRRGYVETGTSDFPAHVKTRIPCHFIEMTKTL